MTKSLVLSFIGHDRPGLVNAISETVAAAGANWQDSRLARLAGEFAGIVLITVPESEFVALTSALNSLEKIGLRIAMETSTIAPQADAVVELNLVGQDRPGIVREMTEALGKLNVNIEEFTSDIESAPFTGETMFRVTAALRLPAGVTSDEVKKALERLADEIMVDLIVVGGV